MLQVSSVKTGQPPSVGNSSDAADGMLRGGVLGNDRGISIVIDVANELCVYPVLPLLAKMHMHAG